MNLTNRIDEYIKEQRKLHESIISSSLKSVYNYFFVSRHELQMIIGQVEQNLDYRNNMLITIFK
jgi:hypothetical protein